jgi:hypothetical protein
MPLPTIGVPTTGSAIQSGSTTTIVSSPVVNAVAAGPSGSVQFNDGGPLGGSSAFSFNKIGNILTVNGGFVTVGSVTASSAAFTGTVMANIFNATTGFEIGGTAPIGQFLRGNGTNFVSAVLSGSDIQTGIVGVQFGGTGSNLSATGGTSEVLLQTTVGGDVTVRQLTFSDIGGSLTTIPIWNTIIETTTYTAVAGDMVLANSAGGGFTVTLPLSSSNKNLSIRVKKTSSDSNTITVARSGADLIDGQTTQIFNRQYTDLEVTADGSGNWWIA